MKQLPVSVVFDKHMHVIVQSNNLYGVFTLADTDTDKKQVQLQECIPVGCVLSAAVAVSWEWGIWQTHTHPVDRILDTRLSKHYLFTTSFVDGNNMQNCSDTDTDTDTDVNGLQTHFVGIVQCEHSIKR